MNWERVDAQPGQKSECEDCTNKLRKPIESGYLCKTSYKPLDILLSPKIITDNGLFICDRYQPNLSTRIKQWVDRAALFFTTHGIQLPQ